MNMPPAKARPARSIRMRQLPGAATKRAISAPGAVTTKPRVASHKSIMNPAINSADKGT